MCACKVIKKCLIFLCFQVAGHFRAASCHRRTCFSWFLPVAHAVIMETARCSTATCARWVAAQTKAASVVLQNVSSTLKSKKIFFQKKILLQTLQTCKQSLVNLGLCCCSSRELVTAIVTGRAQTYFSERVRLCFSNQTS